MNQPLMTGFPSPDFFVGKFLHWLELYGAAWPATVAGMQQLGLVLAAALAAEMAMIGWQRCSLHKLLRPSASAKNDAPALLLTCLNLDGIVQAAMTLGTLYVATRAARQFAGDYVIIQFSNPMLTTLAYILVIDLFAYWIHRLSHCVPLLWALHRYHHSASEMNMVNGFRVHPVYSAIYALWMCIPLIFLGVPAEYPLVIGVLFRFHGLLKHSNLESDWGWFGRILLQSPQAHRLHHSIDEQHQNRNFSDTFQFWDLLFGTELDASVHGRRPLRFGVRDDAGTGHPLGYILRIYAEFLGACIPPLRPPPKPQSSA